MDNNENKLESNPNFFKSIQDTHRKFQILTFSTSALTIASLFIGIIRTINNNQMSRLLIAPHFLLALSASIYIFGNDPCTLLFKNISEQEKNNLKDEDLLEACNYIRTNIIK